MSDTPKGFWLNGAKMKMGPNSGVNDCTQAANWTSPTAFAQNRVAGCEADPRQSFVS